jgi:hypothetical protein
MECSQGGEIRQVVYLEILSQNIHGRLSVGELSKLGYVKLSPLDEESPTDSEDAPKLSVAT